jgi:hypothetical protein
MKETDDRPIELLLRRHAQRNSGLPGTAASSAALSSHLDADELNALAENAVPASARARFNSHLVDCDHCRKLVSALSINASTASLIESEAAEDKSNKRSFWGMLAALFSLPLMRYGVPALAMALLVVVALIALKSNRDAEFIALETKPANDGRIVITASPDATIQSQPAPESQLRGNTGPASAPVAPGAPLSELAKDAPKDAAKDAGAAPAGKAGVFGNYPGAANVQQPTFAPDVDTARNETEGQFKSAPAAGAPPPKPEAAPELKLADKDRALEVQGRARRDETHDQVANLSRDGETTSTSRIKALGSDTKQKGGPRRSQQSEQDQRGGRATTARKAEASAETRTVSGHRFRREGNTWVDAAYDSSKGMTTLSRGSEKYQKLANEHAGLRAIVEELGSVIVVWNGKQYGIQ